MVHGSVQWAGVLILEKKRKAMAAFHAAPVWSGQNPQPLEMDFEEPQNQEENNWNQHIPHPPPFQFLISLIFFMMTSFISFFKNHCDGSTDPPSEKS